MDRYCLNDMSIGVSSFAYMYADDTKICKEISDTLDRMKLQVDLNNIQKWSDQWQLKFNNTICQVMHLENANDRPKYLMKDIGTEVSLESTLGKSA